jgi:hypothetical protein
LFRFRFDAPSQRDGAFDRMARLVIIEEQPDILPFVVATAQSVRPAAQDSRAA